MKRRGWCILGLSILILGLTWLQNSLNEAQQDRKEKNQKQSFDSSLIVLNNQFEANNRKTILSITRTQTEILGKYGYKLDSANNKLVSVVRDSSKTKVYLENKPVFTLCNDTGISFKEETTKAYSLNVSFCSYDAGSFGHKLTWQAVYSDSLNQLYIAPQGKIDNYFNKDFKMQKNSAFSAGLNIQKIANSLLISTLYLYIKGVYYNIDKTKSYNVDELYYFDIKTKKFGIIMSDEREKIVKFINKNN